MERAALKERIINLRAYKEKQFLIFEFADGKNVKYDMASKKMIGKRGKPVNGLTSQLAGLSINEVIQGFEDEKYRRYLDFVKNQTKQGSSYSNVGTFLDKIRGLSRFEQYFAAGVANVDPSLKQELHEIPKDLVKLSREYGITISEQAIEQIKIHKDIIRNIFELRGLRTLTKVDIERCTLSDSYASRRFNSLVLVHNYNYESLIRYLDNLMTFEGLERICDIVRELQDYVNMMSALSHKYEKYPKNFLTTHKIAARNYNRLKQEFDEEIFSNIRAANANQLQCTIGNYDFIYPASTQAIKDEAVQQQNCLASYIQSVLENKCHIIFMREKSKPDQSLVTLEVQGICVTQAKGKFNREVFASEKEAIEKYQIKIKQGNGGK